jgi:hypothetical protein
LHVKEWKFSREDPECAKTAYYQEKLFQFLNECKGEKNPGSSFSIKRDQAAELKQRFSSRKMNFELDIFPKGNPGPTNFQLYKILLLISDNKINLEGSQFFCEEIMKDIFGQLKSKYASRKTFPHGKRLETMVKFIQETTKVTHLQIVAYMQLFDEYKQEILTEREHEEILNFLKELWVWLLDRSSEAEKIHWANKVHNLLNFHSINKSNYSLQRKTKYMKFVGILFLVGSI